MSGGGGTQAGGPAPIPLLSAETGLFGNLPFGNINNSANNAYGGIGGLNTNPASQYGTAGGIGQYLTGMGGAAISGAIPAYNQGVGNAAQFSPFIGPSLAAGFDPLNAQYKQQFQQNQDQANAENAMSGVATTPYGAALTNQSDQDFNLKWQQQQLERELTGAQTAATLGGAQNSALTSGVNNAAALLGAGGGAAQTGLGLGQSIDTQQFNALQQQIQDWLAYIQNNTQAGSAFTGAANNTFGTGVNQANVSSNAALAANQQGLGSLGGLGSLFGSLAKFVPQ